MSTLDRFIPEGKPIHPYDMYELISGLDNLSDVVEVVRSPSPEDDKDYDRNANRIGTVFEIKGKRYFQTCHVPAITRAFK